MGFLTRRTLLIAALATSVAVEATPVQAQDGLNEYAVKAAFIYNFAKFVQWPPDTTSSALVVGVVGDGPLEGLLDRIIAGKTVQGRELVVRRIGNDDDLRSCDIVFVGASEERRTADILRSLQPQPVLTVGETPHFLRDGGMIRFLIEGSRVRFQIDPQNADRARLKISSQLLSLAKR